LPFPDKSGRAFLSASGVFTSSCTFAKPTPYGRGHVGPAMLVPDGLGRGPLNIQFFETFNVITTRLFK
jgi:hypothetical protein